MKGIVSMVFRDKNTLEVTRTIEKTNIITNSFIDTNLTTGDSYVNGINFEVVVSSSDFRPTPFTHKGVFYGTDFTYQGFQHSRKSTTITDVPERMYVEGTSLEDDFIQYSGRFDAPGSLRSIKSVMLVKYDNNVYGNSIPAFMNLDTPCSQQPNEVMDIYYRIVIEYNNDSVISKPAFKEMLKRIGADEFYTTNARIYPGDPGVCISSFPLFTPKQEDKQTVSISKTYFLQIPTLEIQKHRFGYSVTKTGANNILATDLIGSIISGIYVQDRFAGYDNSILYYKSNFFKHKKIQNVFGYRSDNTTKSRTQFYDSGILPTGTGKLYIGGDWENRKPAAVTGLYKRTELPRRDIITITTSGAVGTSKYKYTTQSYLGKIQPPSDPTVALASYPHEVVGLTSIDQTSQDPSIIVSHHSTKGLLEALNNSEFGIYQINASCSYDGTSVLIPKANKVLLYSIASGEYWWITGNFTEITQLAVHGDLVYIACRVSGLYVVNPKLESEATKISVTAHRVINTSNCYGVALGSNNRIWAVFTDAIAYMESGVWSAYDSTTTHPFDSDAFPYSDVAFIRTDTASANNNIFLANRNESYSGIGYWWSTTTVLVELLEYENGSFGNPKKMQRHVGCVNGRWFFILNAYYMYCSFNAVNLTYTDKYVSGSYFGHTTTLSGIHPLKIPTASIWYLPMFNEDVSYGLCTPFVMINSGTLANYVSYTNLTSGVCTYSGTYISKQSEGSDPHLYTNSFMLDNGVMFFIEKTTRSGRYKVNAFVLEIGLNNTPHGGTARWVTRKEYGWNTATSQWELNNAGTKFTHTDDQPLLENVTARFEDGVSGTSFVANEFYKFGLCEGLLKDNVTRFSLDIPIYFSRTTSGVLSLSDTVVRPKTNGQTGIVDVHPIFKSKGAYKAADDRIVMPGNNIGQYVVGNKPLLGDFEFQFPPPREIHKTIPLADTPNGACYNSSNKKRYVACQNGKILVIDDEDQIETEIVLFDTVLVGACYNPVTSTVWIANNGTTKSIIKINDDNTFVQIPVSYSPGFICHNPVDNSMWITNTNNLFITKISSTDVVSYIATPFQCVHICHNSSNNSIWATSGATRVLRISSTGVLTNLNTNLNGVLGICYNPNDNYVYVAASMSDTIIRINSSNVMTSDWVISRPYDLIYNPVNRSVYTTSYSFSKIYVLYSDAFTSKEFAANEFCQYLSIDTDKNELWTSNKDTTSLTKYYLNEEKINNVTIGVGKFRLGGHPQVSVNFDRVVGDPSTYAKLRVTKSGDIYSPSDYSEVYLSNDPIPPTSVIKFRRVNGVLNIYVDDTFKYSAPIDIVRPADNYLELIVSSSAASQRVLINTPFIATPVTINYNGLGNPILVGNYIDGSGYYGIDASFISTKLPISGKLAGNTAVVRTDGVTPLPGQIALDTDTLALSFNDADIGKSVELSGTLVYRT